VEEGPRGVRSNVLAPGGIEETEGTHFLLMRPSLVHDVPLTRASRRLGTPHPRRCRYGRLERLSDTPWEARKATRYCQLGRISLLTSSQLHHWANFSAFLPTLRNVILTTADVILFILFISISRSWTGVGNTSDVSSFPIRLVYSTRKLWHLRTRASCDTSSLIPPLLVM
jgi:hypothetical protein